MVNKGEVLKTLSTINKHMLDPQRTISSIEFQQKLL